MGCGIARRLPEAPSRALSLLFSGTLLLGSALLFAVQPMFAKMVLPDLGGTPSTWISSMLFFQAALLAGYAYAHWSTRRLGARRQAVAHLVVLLVPLLSLPVTVPRGWGSPVDRPLWWLLSVLALGVGLPFFTVSSTAPLLQRWFAGTSHPQAADPYFLYRASNLGSMAALLGYPVLVEPHLPLATQGRLWALGYGFLALLVLACAVALWRRPRQPSPSLTSLETFDPEPAADDASAPPVTARRRLRWVAWAFLPSSLMLGVTSYITADIAAVPLLWVVPLAAYLLTFVVAFSPSSPLWYSLAVTIQPLVLLELVFLVVVGVTEPVALLVVLNLVALVVSGLVCHGQLARDRPPVNHLTEFYLWIAVGGALGGVFNGLVAPAVFDSVVEYPLAILLACFLRPPADGAENERRLRRLDVDLPLLLGTVTVVALALALAAGLDDVAARATVLGLALLACLAFAGRRARLGLGVAAVLLVAALPLGSQSTTLHRDRTFFGVVQVERDPEAGLHRLVHGNTTHGAQSTDPLRRREPLSYFHRTGPIGQALHELPGRPARSRVAVVGLGTGSLACHGEAGQRWTFYEIDPAVERVARDTSLFTYLRDCPPRTDVVLGDARLSLTRAPDRSFDVLVVDAFNSDAIPVHLLTREALGLYFDKLADGGTLAVHITNRYLDLRPVLGDLARDAGRPALVRRDLDVSRAERNAGKAGSVWVVMGRHPSDLGPLARDPRWQPLPARAGTRVWTDDYSNVVSALDWG